MYSEMAANYAGYHRNGGGPTTDQLRQTRHKGLGSDFVDLSATPTNANTDNIEIVEKTNLHISIAPDEFCRDTILDEQFSFTFSKGRVVGVDL